MLKKNDLLNQYIEKRFEYYFENWYLKKLEKVNPEEAIEAIKLLVKIMDIYRKLSDLPLTIPEVNRFKVLAEKKDYQGIMNEFIINKATSF
jgi:aspartate-semialdehyde dehydrogenase